MRVRIRCVVYENSKTDFSFDYFDCYDFDVSFVPCIILFTYIFGYGREN